MAKKNEDIKNLEFDFSDDLVCINFVASMRWTDGIAVCPKCESTETSFLSTRKIWKCKKCKKQFSVKVGTIFEDSPIKLDKWLMAIWLITNCKNGVSSYEIHRAIGVTQKTAWFMLHRIRLAMETGSLDDLIRINARLGQIPALREVIEKLQSDVRSLQIQVGTLTKKQEEMMLQLEQAKNQDDD